MSSLSPAIIEGCCGSCTKFDARFLDEDSGYVMGCCPFNTRPGSISDRSPKCDGYEPVEAIRPAEPVAEAGTGPSRSSSDGSQDAVALGMARDTLRGIMKEVMADLLISNSTIKIGDRWEGGSLVLEPGRPGVAGKEIPIDAFFNKIVMVRDRLRVLEQKINANKTLSNAEKVDLQQYITRIYGSLTTFNVLFADQGDRFKGESSKK